MSWAAVAANTVALSKMTEIADGYTHLKVKAPWIHDPALPPHFPHPSVDPIAQLEAALAEKDEIVAAQYAEMKGWRTQLETALARIAELERGVAQECHACLIATGKSVILTPTSKRGNYHCSECGADVFACTMGETT